MASRDAATRGDRVAAAARALRGARFRPQGRGADGMDCLGLVLAAAHEAGISAKVGAPALRGLSVRDARALLQGAGCVELAFAAAAPGDVLLAAPATGLVHLAVKTDVGVVEAHARLGRVVERPLAAGENWDSAWRLPAGDG